MHVSSLRFIIHRAILRNENFVRLFLCLSFIYPLSSTMIYLFILYPFINIIHLSSIHSSISFIYPLSSTMIHLSILNPFIHIIYSSSIINHDFLFILYSIHPYHSSSTVNSSTSQTLIILNPLIFMLEATFTDYFFRTRLRQARR